MASASLSPRQKMINMMYLVLLAMLALNVSSEVLDSFQRIRDDLRISATEARGQGNLLLASLTEEINREVEREGNTQNQGLLDTLEQIDLQVSALLQILATHTDTMEALARFDPERMAYINPDELDDNFTYWMGYPEEANERRGNGAAMRLRDSLNQVFTSLHHLAGIEGSPFEVKDPVASPDDPGKRWEQHTFEGPVLANLATLEALRLEVLRRQQAALEKLGERVGVRQIVVDTMMPIVVPKSEIIVAGLPYEAELYTGMSARTLRPEYGSSSGQISMLPGGFGAKVSIQANPGLIPAGQRSAQQRYSATIMVPLAQGGFDTLRIQKEFTVIQPVIQVKALTVQRLYAQSANDLELSVPALQDQYHPAFSADGAEIIANNQSPERIRVVPGRNSRVRIKVANRYEGSQFPIGSLDYVVVQAPKPGLELRIQGRPYSGMTSVGASQPIQLMLKPDADFEQLMPRDSRYRISSIKILLKDGMQPPRTVGTINTASQDPEQGINIAMPTAVRQARPGAKVYIVVEGIQRINFRGEAIADNRFSELDRTFGFELRR